MKPKLSYTIWFTQRTGSTLLCKALESTGVAGRPEEWLHQQDMLREHSKTSYADLQQHLWKIGSINGVFGIKHSYYEPHFSELLDIFKQFPGCPADETNRVVVWENAFPNHRHIFMARRNKVRLAVSWWKAIQTQEWHRVHGEKPKIIDLTDAYSFDAIEHLYIEASMREAGIQEFFAEGNVVPLTIVYEDFIQRYEETIHTILKYLGLDHSSVKIASPHFDRTADDISEAWVQRFREEMQVDWDNRGW